MTKVTKMIALVGIAILFLCQPAVAGELTGAPADASAPSLATDGWSEIAEGVWFRESPHGGGELFGEGDSSLQWLMNRLEEKIATADLKADGDESLVRFYEEVLADAQHSLATVPVKAGSCSPSASAGPLSAGAQSAASISCTSAQGLTTRAYARAGGVGNTYTGATYGTYSWANAAFYGSFDCYAESYASSASGWWASRWYSGCY